LALPLSLAVLALVPALQRWRAERSALARLGVVVPGVVDVTAAVRAERLAPLLASWETVGGCGAGASTGGGGSVKWIGRNVSGGLIHTEVQGSYVKTVDGYNYVATSLVTTDLGEKWNIGVAVPYLYKYIYNPYGLNFDVANKGLGDVNFLLTRRLGPINDYTLTLAVGAPTGVYNATLIRAKNEVLRQDLQLGAGRPTGSVMLDHTIDNIWGPTVIGAIAGWRGGQNPLQNYRAPSASVYGYMSYLLGPFAPALGLIATGAPRHDRNQGGDQNTALFSAAAQVSLEWSTDWIAVMLAGLVPYQYDGAKTDVNGLPRNPWSVGAWVVSLGVAVSPF
jgi:hypothetical protein